MERITHTTYKWKMGEAQLEVTCGEALAHLINQVFIDAHQWRTLGDPRPEPKTDQVAKTYRGSEVGQAPAGFYWGRRYDEDDWVVIPVLRRVAVDRMAERVCLKWGYRQETFIYPDGGVESDVHHGVVIYGPLPFPDQLLKETK